MTNVASPMASHVLVLKLLPSPMASLLGAKLQMNAPWCTENETIKW
jgi:hypothetical protein